MRWWERLFPRRPLENLQTDKETMTKIDKETSGPRVVWHLENDGLKPTQTPHWFIGRNPFERSLPPGSSMDIRLCLAANCNLIAVPSGAHIEVPMIIPAGQEVVVRVVNKSEYSPLVIGDKEGVVRLFPLLLPPNIQSEEG